jgi:electron transport complex protein RnfG
VRKDFIAPILALGLICFVMAGALALVNHVTAPIIETAAAERAEAARKDIIPGAYRFEEIEDAGLPSGIRYAHKAVDVGGDVLGYTFIVSVKGFGGEMRVICGIDAEGNIIKSSILLDGETRSFKQRVTDVSERLEGEGRSLLDVDAVSNATVTFTAYRSALSIAVAAFNIITGVGE